MKALIEVFQMTEVSVEVRIRMIIKLGGAINHQYGMNLTDELVEELVSALDPNHPSLVKGTSYDPT